MQVKATHPNTPLTLYANGSGGLLERMAGTGADVIGLDWTVDMADARRRLGANQAVQVGVGCEVGVVLLAFSRALATLIAVCCMPMALLRHSDLPCQPAVPLTHVPPAPILMRLRATSTRWCCLAATRPLRRRCATACPRRASAAMC